MVEDDGYWSTGLNDAVDIWTIRLRERRPGAARQVATQDNRQKGCGAPLALEYYGGWGPLTKFDPLRNTGEQIYPAVNLNFGADWEFNVAVGFGLTPATDHLLAKVILGRRFGKERRPVD